MYRNSENNLGDVSEKFAGLVGVVCVVPSGKVMVHVGSKMVCPIPSNLIVLSLYLVLIGEGKHLM